MDRTQGSFELRKQLHAISIRIQQHLHQPCTRISISRPSLLAPSGENMQPQPDGPTWIIVSPHIQSALPGDPRSPPESASEVLGTVDPNRPRAGGSTPPPPDRPMYTSICKHPHQSRLHRDHGPRPCTIKRTTLNNATNDRAAHRRNREDDASVMCSCMYQVQACITQNVDTGPRGRRPWP